MTTEKRRDYVPPIPQSEDKWRLNPQETERRLAAVGIMIAVFGAVCCAFSWDSDLAFTSALFGIPSAYYFWRSSRAR